MKNEIVRKLTSLTLMTIMFAGGLTFAIPGVMPEASAAHNANLFVSAENSFSSNTFGGPMVVEVVISDSSIAALDDALGEPIVSVNGDRLRLLQADDGSWYGYFADKTQAQRADQTQNFTTTDTFATFGTTDDTRGRGLNFGKFCTPASAGTLLDLDFNPTEGVAIARDTLDSSGSDGTFTFGSCALSFDEDGGSEITAQEMNVIRENRTLNKNSAGNTGTQAGNGQGIRGAAINFWPFIQLYDFTATGSAVIQYQKGGAVQTTTLAFDTQPSDSINVSFDRTSYPTNAQVHFTLQDFGLNIDPTDEDSWTWGSNVREITTNRTVWYQMFNQSGVRDADGTDGAQNVAGNLTLFMFEDNGLLTLNNNTQGTAIDVIELQDNTDSVTFSDATVQGLKGLQTQTISHNSLPITMTETAPNSGIFTSTDEADNSVIRINENCFDASATSNPNQCRGTSATISYDDTSYSILVSTVFATIIMDETVLGGEWNSGEEIPVTLVDADANLNSRVDEDLDLFDTNVKLFPAIKIGSPITLASLTTDSSSNVIGASLIRGGNSQTSLRVYSTVGFSDQRVDTFSEVARISLDSGTTLTALPTTFTLGDDTSNTNAIRFELSTTDQALIDFLGNGSREDSGTGQSGIFHYLNYDLRSFANLNTTRIAINITDDSSATNIGGDFYIDNRNKTGLGNILSLQGLIDVTNTLSTGTPAYDFSQGSNDDTVRITFNFTGFSTDISLAAGNFTAAVDLFRFGTSNDGDSGTGVDRFNDAIYRLELEETGDNTNTFIGSVEYIMLNQININQTGTYSALIPISDEVTIIIHEDLTDEDAVRVNYNDLAGDGTILAVADQQAAPTHSGVVSFDFDSYKIGDTVTIRLTDQDLNVDSEVIDIFTVVRGTSARGDTAFDQVGRADYGTNTRGDNFGRLLDITFDDQIWRQADQGSVTCSGSPASPSDDGLGATGFTLAETGIATGVFTGTFAIPSQYCARGSSTGSFASVTGTDMEVNYVDYRDASGEIIEVGDGAGVRANTGSISLDRTVYPVPWGSIADYETLPTGKTPTTGTTTRSLFPIHATGISSPLASVDETLPNGDVTVHIRVNDPDFNIATTGTDFINQNVTDTNYGPVKIMVQRGNTIATLATAGARLADTGVITSGSTVVENGTIGTSQSTIDSSETRELGPISEVSPDAGIFELDFAIRFTDGPLSTSCPTGVQEYTNLNGDTANEEDDRFFVSSTATGAFAAGSTTAGFHCILQGDILTVEYTDPSDASGNVNTVTDSATFDLRNGVLQSDKSVYIIGSDMILTLIEPDFDRDNDTAETYDLDLIEWDSDAAELTMGNKASVAVSAETGSSFDPEPSNFRETGDSTGIFQIVIEIPSTIGGTRQLDRGEAIELEYTDWGPSGADYVGEEDQDINLQVFTSNFGATVELDQKVYTWTDKVFITIVAPDHNFDSNLVDEIGETSDDPVIVQTRTAKLNNYKLAETGTDTGIFTGEVILAGFIHDADGNPSTGDSSGNDITSSSTQTGSGPTDGKLSATDNDGLTISFEFNEDETVVGSALIRWNIGEASWLEASYPATGTGVVRIVDPDMNLNPESVDNFGVDVWSDSDAGGIDLTVTETNEATGIFEGTVFFTVTDESSGHRLRVAEGDTITAEYEDNTLPDPYTTADELEITGTAIIGTIVPPLERAPAANARVVDAFGNSLTSVSVDQQVQIAADLSNGQDRDQKFAYLVQIQDESGVTVSLAWITGSLTAGQSFSPALSWIPDEAGTYTATVFVWESVDNPTALSPTVTTTINVS